MNPIFRQLAYFVAFLAFVSATVLSGLGIVSRGGAFVGSATLGGLALVALGLWLGTMAEQG